MTVILNVTAAKTNPSKYFANPHEVLMHPELSRETKLDILHQWETDARLMSVAEEESMTDGESSRLGAVVSALIALNDEDKHPSNDRAAASPAKHG